jgi:hypothetical protein
MGKNRGSSVSTETRLRAGRPGSSIPGRCWEFFATAVYVPALGSIHLPVQWAPVVPSRGVKRPGREADHSHLVPRLGMLGAVPPLPEYFVMAWCLVKHRDTFTSTVEWEGVY